MRDRRSVVVQICVGSRGSLDENSKGLLLLGPTVHFPSPAILFQLQLTTVLENNRAGLLGGAAALLLLFSRAV